MRGRARNRWSSGTIIRPGKSHLIPCAGASFHVGARTRVEAASPSRQVGDGSEFAHIPGGVSQPALDRPGGRLFRAEGDHGQPYAIAMKDGGPFGIGGLWTTGESGRPASGSGPWRLRSARLDAAAPRRVDARVDFDALATPVEFLADLLTTKPIQLLLLDQVASGREPLITFSYYTHRTNSLPRIACRHRLAEIP